MSEIDNSGFFDQVAFERAVDTINNGPPGLAVHLYQMTRDSWLKQTRSMHGALTAERRKWRILQNWVFSNRIKYLEHDIRGLQVKMATMRQHYYKPENRMTRAMKGY